MSDELKTRLEKVAQEGCKEELQMKMDLPRARALLLKIQLLKKFDLLLVMEGTVQLENEKDEEILELLERANLVKGETKFTHRNFYRQYQLTAKGTEITQQIAKEPESQLLSQPNL
jgi:hypothetical protein